MVLKCIECNEAARAYCECGGGGYSQEDENYRKFCIDRAIHKATAGD